MIYRDKCFCAGNGCVKFVRCHRSLTPEIQKKADVMGLLIAQFADPKALECYRSEITNDGEDGLL